MELRIHKLLWFVDYSLEDLLPEDYSLRTIHRTTINRTTINREDNSPGDCSSEDCSSGVESFEQFSQIARNNADKVRVFDNDQQHKIFNSHQIYTKTEIDA